MGVTADSATETTVKYACETDRWQSMSYERVIAMDRQGPKLQQGFSLKYVLASVNMIQESNHVQHSEIIVQAGIRRVQLGYNQRLCTFSITHNGKV